LQAAKFVGAVPEFLELGAGAQRMDGKGSRFTPLTRQHLTPNLLYERVADILE